MANRHTKKEGTKPPSAPVDVVVITALEEERDAFLSKVRARKLDKEAGDIHTYYVSAIRTRRRDRSEYKLIVTCLLSMGPINAAVQAVTIVNRWRPRFVLLVGITCGIRGEVTYGDVLVASQVADYTLGKQLDGQREIRWEVFPCGPSLLDSSNNLGKWQYTIGVPRPEPGTAKRHKGVIASGGDVISDDLIIATYSKSWPKLIGVEMEAGGVAAGLHQTSDRPEFLMIKGVSDFGKDKHDPQVKPWRNYARHAAAAFALSLIKSGPTRSVGELTEREQAASAEDEKRRAAERQWQYIQTHPIRGVKILFILKGAVGFDWFREVLEETRLNFSRDDQSFNLGQVLAVSPAPNTQERPPASDKSVCAFWEIYRPEQGYWFAKIAPTPSEFSIVAGFDSVVPWPMFGVQRVAKLEDLALLTDIGVSIPARAYQIGIEEFAFSFVGDTFSFSVRLSEHGLDFLHEMARVQHTVVKDGKPIPIGSNFSGVQLLDLFLHQLLPKQQDGKTKHGIGMMGLSGPDGNAITFYPTMPLGFNKTAESNEYVFNVTMPPKIDSAAHIKKLEKKLMSTPADADLYFELASGYLYEGRLQDGLQCLGTAIKEAPTNANVHGLMGQTLRKLGRFDEALAHCQKASVLAPDDARIQAELGICLAELGKRDVALVHFEAAARLEPLNPGYQSNLCMALINLNRYSEATVPAQRAVDLAPDDSRSAMLLGILFDKQGQQIEALRYLEKATQLSPHSADAHQHLGMHLAESGQHERAVASFQRAIEIEENARRWELLGGALAELGRWSEAEEAFRRGVNREPGHSGLLANLGAAVATLGRFAEASELLEKSLRLDPTNSAAQQNLALLRQKEGMSE
jgi:tetratricopeptide (TPR) repeat protein/nucleoside phosphorylase